MPAVKVVLICVGLAVALFLLIAIGSALLFILPGGKSVAQVWQQASIRLVKDATLAGYSTATIGQAFDGKFPDGKWTSFVNAQKVTVVEFDGTVTADAMAAAGVPGISDGENRLRPEVLEQCAGGVRSPCRLREKFQFFLSADRDSFEIGATETVPKDPKAVLDFVYR